MARTAPIGLLVRPGAGGSADPDDRPAEEGPQRTSPGDHPWE